MGLQEAFDRWPVEAVETAERQEVPLVADDAPGLDRWPVAGEYFDGIAVLLLLDLVDPGLGRCRVDQAVELFADGRLAVGRVGSTVVVPGECYGRRLEFFAGPSRLSR